MKTIVQKLRDRKFRRLALVMASGILILLSLGIARLDGASKWADGLMVLAALISGWEIAARAFSSLRNRHISIELLVMIAATGAIFIGEYWEAAAVTFLFILGAYLEARTLSQTRKVVEGLLDLAPTTAIVIRDGHQVEVLPHEVKTGEAVMVKPGAKVAVDGVVLSGQSTIDESAITGEPIPEEKTAGSEVFAGTLNQAGLLQVRATGVGADTTLARIIRRVEEAQDEKAPTQRFIERFSQWYTPFIIALSGIAYLISGDIELSLTLLVIGCPGALVISTPVSVVAGIGRAAKSGILIKGGEYLENAGKISAVAFDKTGTLTEGKPVVTDVIPLNGHREEEILIWAAAAEAGSEHPLARAIINKAEARQDLLPIEEFKSFTGLGVQVAAGGHLIAVGSEDLMADLGVELPPDSAGQLLKLKSAGKTSVLVSLDGRAEGVLGIADTLRKDAPNMIRQLKENGVRRVVMLTGDDKVTAEAIAQEVGLDEVHAGLLPEEKLQAIRKMQAEGHVVAMVGDGINDAPALAAADIGIAMGAGGTDIAIETADIALISDDLLKLPEAVRLSKATLRNIRQNVVVALLTVAGLLSGVILGMVHMAGGMLVHEASVLLVILNGMRLLKD